MLLAQKIVVLNKVPIFRGMVLSPIKYDREISAVEASFAYIVMLDSVKALFHRQPDSNSQKT